MCLRGGKRGKAVTKARAKLRELCLAGRRRAVGRANVVLEDLVATIVSAHRDVATGIQRQAVKPRRERGLAAELTELLAEPGERLLGGVAGVIGVGKDVMGEAQDAGLMSLAQRLESARIAVLRTPDENRVAQSTVRELGLGPERSTDPTAGTSRRLHQASLLPAATGPTPERPSHDYG